MSATDGSEVFYREGEPTAEQIATYRDAFEKLSNSLQLLLDHFLTHISISSPQSKDTKPQAITDAIRAAITLCHEIGSLDEPPDLPNYEPSPVTDSLPTAQEVDHYGVQLAFMARMLMKTSQYFVQTIEAAGGNQKIAKKIVPIRKEILDAAKLCAPEKE